MCLPINPKVDKKRIVLPFSMENKIFIAFTGPSGSGKSTILKHILSKFPCLQFSISHTSRPPRLNEVNGKQYFFISRKEFEDLIKNNKLIEYTEYNNNYYGTSISQIENTNKILVLDLESDGVKFCKNSDHKNYVIYIHCDKELTRERMIERAGGDKTKINDEIESRMVFYDQFVSIKTVCDYVIDNSYSLEKSKEEAVKIIELILSEKV